MTNLMPPVDARRKSIKELLSGQKYAIDYYQREYLWQEKHIQELIEDLQSQFSTNYQESHVRSQVEHYSHYFLGSIVVSSRGGQKFIIDGQQRLTSLTLLLIFLHNIQLNRSDVVDVSSLVFSEKFGKKSFNLDVPERIHILESLYNGDYFDVNNQNESIQNIEKRYQNIISFFPESLRGKALPYFIDWLNECVDFVEITAFSDEVAYTIFETMNDRGLSLSPTDMLKGYLLANLDNNADRDFLNLRWRDLLSELSDAGVEDVSEFFKAWLRGRYARSIRGSIPGEQNKDWEKIVNAFHKWVRDERENIGLLQPDDFRVFLKKDFEFYIGCYTMLRQAANRFSFAKEYGIEAVHYNANNGYTLQYPLIISALQPDDSKEKVLQKIRVVSNFLDIFIARRFISYKTIATEATKGRVFNWITSIRNMDISDLIRFFQKRLDEMDEQGENFEKTKEFTLHQQNRQRVHHILARITYYLESSSGVDSSFDKYSSKKAKTPYEIEHIWADRFDFHQDEFESESEFRLYRNRFGDLVLLPRGTNQSYGAHPYDVKVRHYIKENLLVQSLHPRAYELNPNFIRIIEKNNLPFRPHHTFKKKDIDEMQALYKHLCEIIWSPSRLKT